MSRRLTGVLILSFFFFSGLSGLVYEVVWTRLLGLVMGHTVYSITTVLAAFMGGLGLGSYLGGRYVDRKGRAILLYGILEGLIGLYCLLLPLLIQWVEPLFGFVYRDWYGSFYLFSVVRFVICGLLLLVPTTLMGATLPILSKYFVSDTRKVGFTIGRLYAINTFGAVAGSLLSGFVLIPVLGTWGTIVFGVVVNLGIAVAVVLFFRDAQEPGPVERKAEAEAAAELAPSSEVSPGLYRLVLVGFAFSGCAAMIYQVGWTRTLSLVIGSSTYAFTLMVTAFICGLALGSVILSSFVDRSRHLIRLLGVTNLVVAASAALVVPLLGELPLWMVKIVSQYGHRFGVLTVVEFGLIFSVMLVPTFVMGVMFPIVSRITTTDIERVGRSIGTAYASNTVGAIVGSVVGGFLLIPLLGTHGALLIAVCINGAFGLLFVLANPEGRRFVTKFLVSGLGAAAVLAAVFVPPRWDQSLLLSGAYVYADRFQQGINDLRARGVPEHQIPDMREMMATGFGHRVLLEEGANTTVTAHRLRGTLSMQVNGKTDASTGDDMRSQKLLAHIPMLLHQDPQDVLVVGLASGVTTGSVGRYPVSRIDCVEISESVTKATRLFDAYNYGIMDDPKVDLIIGDGRTHVALTDREYDVIISQPSNPWIAGIGFLFTKEYFELCRERLAGSGVVAIWFQRYQMEESDLQSIIRTFYEVFPEAHLFEMISHFDYLLVGSMKELSVPWERLSTRFAEEAVAADLKKILIEEPAALMGLHVMDRPQLVEFCGDARVHTDDNSLIEFRAPKSLYGRTKQDRFSDIDRFRKPELPGFVDKGQDQETWPAIEERVGVLFAAAEKSRQGIEQMRLGRPDEADVLFEEALGLYDRDLEARYYLIESYVRKCDLATAQGQIDEAVQWGARAMQLDSWRPLTLLSLGTALFNAGNYADAREACTRVLKIDPDVPEALFDMAVLSEVNEEGVRYGPGFDVAEAITYYERVLEVYEGHSEAHYNLGFLYFQMDRIDDSIERFRRCVELDPRSSQGYDNLGFVLKTAGRNAEALEVWYHFLTMEGIDPGQEANIRAEVQALEQLL